MSPNAFELLFAATSEGQARAGDEVAHRARDEHLARVCSRSDTGADVHGQPSDVHRVRLEFTGVDARTHRMSAVSASRQIVSAHRTALLGLWNTLRVPSPVTVIRRPPARLDREPDARSWSARSSR